MHMKTTLLLLLAILTLPANAEFSTWTTKDGRKSELELVRATDKNGEKTGEFRMKTGRTITLKASALSEDDAKRLAAESGVDIPKNSPYAATLNKLLVKVKDKKFTPCKLVSVPQYIAFYFSAHWCGPCRAFTPKLVEFYNANHQEDAKFDVVFVSSDNSEADMKTYMTDAGMPWPAISYDKISKADAVRKLSGRGIPCLVVVDLNGKVIKDSYENGQYIGPSAVMAELEKLNRK
jgi:nucleoredoxin